MNISKNWMLATIFAVLTPLTAFAGGAAVLDHTMTDIDGNEVELSQYAGEVLLVVNVASKCGLTPQYEQLVALHAEYREQGFTILAFPANNFLGQEPGTDAEIKEFCTGNYGVEFPVFSKISVKGEDKAALYEELTSEEANGEFGGEIEWNFVKFLVSREGVVVDRFLHKVKPDDETVIAAIEREIAAERPAITPEPAPLQSEPAE